MCKKNLQEIFAFPEFPRQLEINLGTTHASIAHPLFSPRNSAAAVPLSTSGNKASECEALSGEAPCGFAAGGGAEPQ